MKTPSSNSIADIKTITMNPLQYKLASLGKCYTCKGKLQVLTKGDQHTHLACYNCYRVFLIYTKDLNEA